MNDPPPLPPPPFWRTWYYATVVVFKPGREAISDADIIGAVANPVRRRRQPNGRWRVWGRNQADTHWLSVILLSDEETLHNAHLDRNFRP